MADVFISYSREDFPFVQQFASRLTDAGLSVWWDKHLTPQSSFNLQLQKEIKAARYVVVIWSTTSVDSEWVHEETSLAKELNKLIPVRVGNAPLPLGYRTLQTADLTNWNGEADHGEWERLMAWLAPEAATDWRDVSFAYWKELLTSLNLDAADQPRPKPARLGNISFRLPGKLRSCWIVLYRSYPNDTVGIFLTAAATGDGADLMKRFKEAVPDPRPFLGPNVYWDEQDERLYLIEKTTITNFDNPPQRDRSMTWQCERINAFINWVRPEMERLV